VSAQQLEEAIYTEIEKIKKDGVTDRELQKVKNQRFIDFYNQIETINGKSNNIGTYEVFFGDYRKMFEAPAKFNQVTLADIQRVANTYFKKSTRTVGVLQTKTDD
jgi:predicted Zn-dependent peptidase